MFSLFNLGHALPLRVRRFSCCRMSARSSAHVRAALLHRQLRYLRDNRGRETTTTRIRFVRCTAARRAASTATRVLPTLLHHL